MPSPFRRPAAGYATITVRRDALTVGTTVESVAANDPRIAVTLTWVGHPVAHCEIRIADDRGEPLPDNAVGHVQIRGDNVTRGYYQDPEVDAQSPSAPTAGSIPATSGFLSEGGLVITGRAKEIIFVSGQNYYPHDIEAVLDKHAGIELGKAAVCGVRPPTTQRLTKCSLSCCYRGELR